MERERDRKKRGETRTRKHMNGKSEEKGGGFFFFFFKLLRGQSEDNHGWWLG